VKMSFKTERRPSTVERRTLSGDRRPSTERRPSTVENTNRTKEVVASSHAASSINRIFEELKLEPYQLILYQQLNEDDPDRRLQFCEIWQKRVLADRKFPQNIIWSGEAKFHCGSGIVTTHNCVLSSDGNYHNEKENTTNTPGVTVFGALWNEELIGPIFFDAPLTSENYLEALNTTIFPYIVSLHSSQMNAKHLIFQQDGAPPHFGAQVRDALNSYLPEKWIGRRGCIDWPPKSPDLTPIDYFLWVYLKNRVYRRKFRKVEELKTRIKEEFNSLRSNKHIIKRVTASVNNRISECITNNGNIIKS
jgi:hypothetical protein